MTVAALPMILFPHFLLSLVVKSPPVVALGVWPLILAGVAQPGFAIGISKGSALKGAGETIWPMIATIVGMFAVRMPIVIAGLWLMERQGMAGKALLAVWAGILLDLSFRGGFNWIGFARGTWRHKQV
jgi:Na+-driven multidrug efflux pump